MATCYTSGDPHYLTFDGEMIHFQGNCTYNMASSKGSAVDLPAFNVYTSNERRHGNMHVSYPKYLEVHVFNHVIRLDQGVTVGIHFCHQLTIFDSPTT